MRMIDADTLPERKFPEILCNKFGDGAFYRQGWNDAIDAIVDNEDTVDAVPAVHGQWKAVTEDGEEYRRICSCCGKEAPYDEIEEVYLLYPHCPWCGASMDGGR